MAGTRDTATLCPAASTIQGAPASAIPIWGAQAQGRLTLCPAWGTQETRPANSLTVFFSEKYYFGEGWSNSIAGSIALPCMRPSQVRFLATHMVL